MVGKRKTPPIDLATVADARRRLAELAEKHPEAFSPDRLPRTERALARALAVDPDPKQPVMVRLRASTVAALAERAAKLHTKPGTLARTLIEAGLAEAAPEKTRNK